LNLVAEGLGMVTLVAGWLILIAALIWSFMTAPWQKIEKDRNAQHVLLGFTVIVFFVWQFGASIGTGFTFHFLLMTLMTMMFTPQFAILGMLLALTGVTFQSELGWQAIGINAVVMGLVPIAVAWGMYRVGAKFLEANFFVYVIYNGFFSAAVGVVVSLLLGALVLAGNDVFSYQELKHNYLPYIPLMATPEGFVNGMILVALIMLKPNWISTFHDDNYINGK
jgi:uncharacterized membrane protein